MNGTRTCSIHDCNRPHLARSLCSLHYSRLNVYGSTDAPKKTWRGRDVIVGCSFSGCELAHYAKSLCRMHWQRNHTNGTPEVFCFDRSESVKQRLKRKSMSVGECLEYTGARDKDGYGIYSLGKRNPRAHRVAYVESFGPIPAGVMVRHTCDNPPCINPRHLMLGTGIDNSRDMVLRGRSLRGDRNPMARLSVDQVLAIVTRIESGALNTELSAEYDVGASTISRIRHRKSWKQAIETRIV